jgi:hypothetical protein
VHSLDHRLLKELQQRHPGQPIEGLIERTIREHLDQPPGDPVYFTEEEKSCLTVIVAAALSHFAKLDGGIPAFQSKSRQFIERLNGWTLFPSEEKEAQKNTSIMCTQDLYPPTELSFIMFAKDVWQKYLATRYHSPIRLRMWLAAGAAPDMASAPIGKAC